MNDQRRVTGSAGAALAPKQASVSQMIENDLSAILDRERGMYTKLRDLEGYLFGDRDNDQSDSVDTPEPNSWNDKVKYKLDRISEIQQKQIESFDKISRFHL